MEEVVNLPYFQCIKTSLRKVVRNEIVIEKLENAAVLTNRIMTHGLQFIKLYLIHCFDQGDTLPMIDKPFVNAVFKILCKAPTIGRKPSEATQELKSRLTQFYQEHYEYLALDTDTMNYKNLNTVLDYMSIDVITMYNNNIKQHFVEYVERFVNVVHRKEQKIQEIKDRYVTTHQKKTHINTLCHDLRKIKNDILSVNEQKTSPVEYHTWIDAERINIMPQRPLQEQSIYYDIQCSPQEYLCSMVYMMKVVEWLGCTIYNVFPLRSTIIPKNFLLDTTSLVHLLLTTDQGNKADFIKEGNLKKNQAKLWNFFFKTDMKCFHRLNDEHKYTFHHQIRTDGVSCSILLIRKDMVGRTIKTPKPNKGGDEKYIDELAEEELTLIKDKKVVAIDPNMSDLIFCVDSDEKNQTQFRYTQDQRRKETKVKKYRNILQELKTNTIIHGRRVEEWEAQMSNFNKKTLDFAMFKVYIKHKNELNKRLAPFYNR
jgi:hypothetical protein